MTKTPEQRYERTRKEAADLGAEVFTKQEFDELVYQGSILPGVDGIGFWGTKDVESSTSINRPSEEHHTHVYWYEK